MEELLVIRQAMQLMLEAWARKAARLGAEQEVIPPEE